MNACFSQSEAEQTIGTRITTVAELPDIPAGTRGSVVAANECGARGWVARIRWDLPPKRSEIMAQFGDISFNLPWRTRWPLADFSKAEFERLLQRVDG